MEMTGQCIFDKRITIRSAGRLPHGVAVEMPAGPHLSRLHNPLIADAFQRTGAADIWHRDTNRVIDERRRYGVEPHTISEEAMSVIVTFKVQLESMQDRVTGEVTGEVTETMHYEPALSWFENILRYLNRICRACS